MAGWYEPRKFTAEETREYLRRRNLAIALQSGALDYIETRGDDEVPLGYFRPGGDEDDHDEWGGMDGGIGWFGDK